jgi:hypothetical protein
MREQGFVELNLHILMMRQLFELSSTAISQLPAYAAYSAMRIGWKMRFLPLTSSNESFP